jgi:hypothetical protein
MMEAQGLRPRDLISAPGVNPELNLIQYNKESFNWLWNDVLLARYNPNLALLLTQANFRVSWLQGLAKSATQPQTSCR